MQQRKWTGSLSNFQGELETKLAFEGLRKKDLLIQAGYQSLREYVDLRLRELAS
jgi:hypothetical protein